jgi:hypothetical protein
MVTPAKLRQQVAQFVDTHLAGLGIAPWQAANTASTFP